MKRALIALLVINSFPAPALAQIARVAAPARMPLTVPALSVAAPAALTGLTPVLSAPSLSVPLAAAPVPAALALPLPLKAVPAAPVPVKPEAEPVRALTAAKTAAASAAVMAAAPGTLEFDRSRVDFTDGSARRPSLVETVVSAVPTTGSGRAAAFRARFRLAAVTVLPRPPRRPPRLAPFLGGTFLAQVASNALQVTMPLLILQVTGSAATAAFAATASSAVDAFGTLIGGRLTDRFGSKPVLVGTTIARGAAVLALPLLASAGLTLPAVLAVYVIESLARGVADTARNTVPSEIAGKDEGLLKKVLSKNQSYFEAGGIAGPFLAGALIADAGGVAAAGAFWLAPPPAGVTSLTWLNTRPWPRCRASRGPEGPGQSVGPWMKWLAPSP
jgi:hypothetical protein